MTFPPQPNEWLSPTEFAALVGVPVRSVYVWNSRGTGPRRHTIGRHCRYRRTDIETWLEQQVTP
jgi:excisionase family DNA binding protein